MTTQNNQLYIITGQTGTGKTGLALQLAKKIGGYIISADARQAYMHLDVITGKDALKSTFTLVEVWNNFRLGYYTVDGVELWLYDVVDPKVYFSAYEWSQCAQRILELKQESKSIPVIVGGTYFYIQTLLYGLTEGPVANWELRKKLETLAVAELREKAKELSSDDFHKLNNSDAYNPRRLIRFIEKHQSNSEVAQVSEGIIGSFQPVAIGLHFLSTDNAREIITQRVDERLRLGAQSEVETLLSMGYTRTSPGLNTIGYQQLLDYVGGHATLAQARDQWILKEVQYAKRQYTLMKRDMSIVWYTIPGTELSSLVDSIITD